MTVSLTTRLGMTRWSSDLDAWSREQIDGNVAKVEELAVIGTQGNASDRPAAGVQRRLYLATDVERVYLDDGDEWYELLVAGVAPASAIVFTPAGDVAATNVQAALAELASEKATNAALTAHVDDTSAAHAASAIGFTPVGSIAATDVQAALAEVASEAGTNLGNHTGAAAGAHAATAISYAGSTNLSATTVEAALDELDTEKAAAADLTAHTSGTSAKHNATAIVFTPTGGISASDVAAALAELDSEKAPKASPVFTGAPATAPAAATDPATTMALVNYLRDRLIAVGLIA
jgi:hypothetical protein